MSGKFEKKKGEDFKCKFCGKLFRSREGLKTHLKSEHPGRYYSLKIILMLVVIIIIISSFLIILPLHEGNIQTTITTPTTTPSRTATYKKAPEFTLPIYNSDKSVSLSDFSNKPVFLEFFSPTCPHCINMMPIIEELTKKYGDRIVFILISTPQEDELKKLMNEHNVKAIVLIDKDLKVFKAYGVRGVPAFFILDRPHNILHTFEGEKSKTILENAILSVL